MPSGIYVRTKEYRDQISESLKKQWGDGKRKATKPSDETKKKISKSLKGEKNFFYGKKLSDDHRRKISEAQKGGKNHRFGKKNSAEMRGKISKGLASDEVKLKLRLAHLGKSSWNKGKIGAYKHTEEAKRKIGESRKGEKAYQWLGGISFEPYGLEFNNDLREVIRNRDRRKCQICEKTELEEKKKLAIHHIDYNKRNNNPNNLITLCNNCHSKTNHSRDCWKNYFTNKL